MKKLLVILLLFYGFSYAEEITGAFGIKFGEKIDKLKVLKKEDKYTVIVDPPKRVDILEEYKVKYTPKSELVYTISAAKFNLTLKQCKSMTDLVKFKLEKKYNISFKEVFDPRSPYLFEGVQDSNAISLGCVAVYSNLGDRAVFFIMYVDGNLLLKADKEKLEIESKTIDDDAL